MNKLLKAMKYHFYFLLFASLFTLLACERFETLEPQPFVTFEVITGLGGFEVITDVLETADNYVIVGASGQDCNILDAYIAKVDKTTGALKGSNRIGKSGFVEDIFYGVIKTNTGFAAVGLSTPKNNCQTNGDGTLVFARFDESLSLIDSVQLTTGVSANAKWETGYDIVAQGGYYYISGAWESRPNIIKIDTSNIKQVEVTNYNYQGAGELKGIVELEDGTLIATGQIRPWSNYDKEKQIILNQVNTNEPNKIYPSSVGKDVVQMENMIATEGGGALLIGWAYNNVNDGFTEAEWAAEVNLYLMKINMNLELEWEKIYPDANQSDSWGYSAVETTDGYAITGYDNQLGTRDMLMLKTDKFGNELWRQLFDFEDLGNFQMGRNIIATSDGGFLMVGDSHVSPNQNALVKSSYLVKTDAVGNLENK